MVPLQNFTDVEAKFTTVIKVLEDSVLEFKEYSIKIWIRRAGPNFRDGLGKVNAAGQRFGLSMEVYGPETHITAVVLTETNGGSIPLRKRSDFKQALSTLERLHQEAGEEPYVPIYSYKHKQWQSAQSSSSTWWKWQDSRLSSYNSESQGRGKQSLGNERGDPLLTLLWRKPQKMAFKNSIDFVTDRSFTADGGPL